MGGRLDRHQVAAELNRALLRAEQREGREFDRRELARRLNMSQASLYAYLNGTTLPRGRTFERLLDLLGVTGDERGRLSTLRDVAEVAARVRTPTRAAAPPRQLPPLGVFAGRARELEVLDRVFDDAPAARVVVVSGTAGIGKTTLALAWAHRVKDHFPDGHLYVDLRGFAPNAPLDPGVALHGFLHAFGVAPAAIPSSTDARSALLRTVLDGRRALVMLDNARSATQIRPLFPGSPGCLTIVTGRARLDSVVVRDGAHRLLLDVMATDDALDVLACRVSRDHLAADPAATASLIEICSGLPLALSVVATRIADRDGQPLADLVTELRAGRDPIEEVASVEVDLDLGTVLRWSYTELSADAARLFRLIGLHPGPDIDLYACAALLGRVDPPRNELRELVYANLLAERPTGRYRFHDLLRAYARTLANEDSEADRRDALRRVFDHYVAMAVAANDRIQPFSTDGTGLVSPSVPTRGSDPRTSAEALRWFDTEWDVLHAVIRHAAADSDSASWRLAWASTVFLRRTGRHAERVAAQRAAVTAARAAGEPRALATSLRLLADAVSRSTPGGEPAILLGEALEIVIDLAEPSSEMRVHLGLARAYGRAGRSADALVHARLSLDLALHLGDRLAAADARTAGGRQLAESGEYGEARVMAEQAWATYSSIGHREGEANALKLLGDIELGLGRPAEAATVYQRSVAIDRIIGDRYWEAHGLNGLADAHAALGNTASSRRLRARAAALLDALWHPEAERIHHRIE